MDKDFEKLIGKQILNYKLTRLIGSGGMATVYEAEHIKFKNKKVAIKVLKPILASNENIKTRFENEASIMAGLEHPNITQVIDFEEKKDILAIVMQFLEGEDLTQYINSKGKLPLDEALNIFYQTLEAFAFAHQNGIAHRDVKPANIFLQKNGVAKILDFGIAKLLSADANLTSTGTQMGTPMYMSPEQVRDSKEIDWRTDIYSLGVVLFYMLNGDAPYKSTETSSFDIQSKIVFEEFPKLDNLPELNEIIAKATAKKPDDRYQTCEEFMFELQKVEKNLNISTEKIKSKPVEKTIEKKSFVADNIKNEKKNENVIIPLVKNKSFDKKKLFIFGGIAATVIIFLILIISGVFGKSKTEKFLVYQLLDSDTIFSQIFEKEELAVDFFNNKVAELQSANLPGSYSLKILRQSDNFKIDDFNIIVEQELTISYAVDIEIDDNAPATMYFNTLDEARRVIDSLIENVDKYYISFYEYDEAQSSRGDSLWSIILGQDDIADQTVAVNYTPVYQPTDNDDDKDDKNDDDKNGNDNNQYDAEKILNNGFKAVKKNGLWAILDKSDVFLTDFKYLNYKSFGNGLLPVRKSSGWFYINEEGDEINSSPFQYADVFQNQMAKVGQSINQETLYGFINQSGQLVIDCKYIAATSFTRIQGQLLSEVTKGTDTYYINKSDRKIRL